MWCQRLAAVDRESSAVVVRYGHAVRVRRVDPDVVVVAVRVGELAREIDDVLPAVERLGEFRGQEVRLVGVVGR